MTTKFYLHQPVKSDMFGYGVVIGFHKEEPHVRFGTNLGTYTPDGRRAKWHPVDLHPVEVEKPKPGLAEWQRGEIGKFYNSSFALTKDAFLQRIESILSEPEPPKYQPKRGDAVWVWNKDKLEKGLNRFPRIFKHMEGNKYVTYYDEYNGESNWDYCIPFDADKVGKVTND